MKTHDYVGVEGQCIVITSPKDIYTVLDWLQTKMMDHEENLREGGFEDKADEYQKSIEYISTLMDKVEADGFGDQFY